MILICSHLFGDLGQRAAAAEAAAESSSSIASIAFCLVLFELQQPRVMCKTLQQKGCDFKPLGA